MKSSFYRFAVKLQGNSFRRGRKTNIICKPGEGRERKLCWNGFEIVLWTFLYAIGWRKSFSRLPSRFDPKITWSLSMKHRVSAKHIWFKAKSLNREWERGDRAKFTGDVMTNFLTTRLRVSGTFDAARKIDSGISILDAGVAMQNSECPRIFWLEIFRRVSSYPAC